MKAQPNGEYFMNLHSKYLLPALLLIGTVTRASTISEPGFSETVYIQNNSLGNATVLAWAPDGSQRLFVARKAGEVRVVKNGALLSTPWATMSPIVTASECGLLGLCFDPSFMTNHYVYLLVTVSSTEQQILRYIDDPATNTGSSRTVLIPGLPTTGTNHNAGCVQIGPDGKIYWTVGNTNNFSGSSAVLRGEDGDVSNLCSKVGRANLDGTAPLNNPFYDGAGPNNEFIFARGLRNPFKFYFQPGNGKLWVNCVGDNYEQIFQMNPGDDAGDRTRENIQGAGRITPAIKYRTNNVSLDTRTIATSGAVRTANVVTFTTTAAHPYRKGENITVSGASDSSFNGTFYVASTPTTTTLTVAQNGINATASGGTIVPLQVSTGTSAAVTGGCFYDGTLFPAQYRGNLFFGDVASGRILRATLDTDNTVKTVDYFASNANQFLDVTVGPDGALYYTTHNTAGWIYRVAPIGSSQGIVLSSTNIRVMEGGSTIVNVSLAAPPSGTVQIDVQRFSGDSDITVAPSTLTFTAANYSTPQAVTIAAAHDADIADDIAVLSFSSPGHPTQTAQVTAVDIDAGSLVLSSASVTINEGQSGTFTVAIPAQPTASVTVAIRISGDPSATLSTPATLTFTSGNWNIPQTVRVTAATDTDTLDGTATVTLSGTGLASSTVAVHIIDSTANAPLFTSNPVLTAVQNAPYNYQAAASGVPAPTFSLTLNPPGMSIDATSGQITWTPSAAGNFDVTIISTNGVQPSATQTFTIIVTADQPPTAQISKPVQDEFISGTNTEFYGNGHDDVGTVKAEFCVDGVLRYTDQTPGSHYHINGSHLLFDTTVFSNGPHTLKMIVYDTIGQTGSHEIGVVVRNLSVVTSATTTATVGNAFTFSVVASNEPMNFSATGLPQGLTIDATTGQIAGTPQQSGSFNATVSVTNIAGVSTGTVAITVTPPAPIVTGGQASATVGSPFTYQIVATNSPNFYGISGQPNGLSVAQNGAITGTPTVSGTFSVTLIAGNDTGSGSAILTLTVAPAPLTPVVPSATASATTGVFFTLQINANNAPESYSAQGLPNGLSVNTTTGAITGTPTQRGTFNVTISATNTAGTGSGTLALTVRRNTATNQAPAFTSAITAMPQPVHALGTATFSAPVADPDDDTIDVTWNFGDGSNAIGNPKTHVFTQPGIYPVIATASDGLASASNTLMLTVYPAPDDINAIAFTTATVKVQFTPGAKNHSAQINGTVKGPVNFLPAGANVAVTLGSFARNDTLNRSGLSTDRKFQLKTAGRNAPGVLKFSLKLDSTDMLALLPLFPNTTIAAPGIRIDVPFSLTLRGQAQLQLLPLNYTARGGKSGSGKLIR